MCKARMFRAEMRDGTMLSLNHVCLHSSPRVPAIRFYINPCTTRHCSLVIVATLVYYCNYLIIHYNGLMLYLQPC